MAPGRELNVSYVQICYGKLESDQDAGWHVYQASDGLSPSECTAFELVEGSGIDTRIQDAAQKGERTTLDVRAIGGYMFLTMTSFAARDAGGRWVQLLDASGRAKACAHGIGCPEAEFARDPTGLLSIGDGCFSATVEGAAGALSRLQMTAPLSRAEALRACGLDGEGYAALLVNVCEALGLRPEGSRIPGALVVRCAADAGAQRALMTAIYLGLPPCLRSRVSIVASSVACSADPTVLLAPLAAGESGVVLQNGAADTAAWSRYPFATVAARTQVPQGQLDAFFDALEARVSSFAKLDTANAQQFQMAFEALPAGSVPPDIAAGAASAAPADRPIDENEFYERLGTVLYDDQPSDVRARRTMDEMLAALIADAMRGGIFLGPDAVDRIVARASRTDSDTLREASFRLLLSVLAKQPPEEAAAYLYRLYPDEAARSTGEFNDIQLALLRDAHGKAVLDCLYGTLIAGDLRGLGRDLSPARIAAFAAKTAELGLNMGPRVRELADAYLSGAVPPAVSVDDPGYLDAEMGRSAALGDALVELGGALPDGLLGDVAASWCERFWQELPLATFPLAEGTEVFWRTCRERVGGSVPAIAFALEAACGVVIALRSGDGRSLAGSVKQARELMPRLDTRQAAELRGNMRGCLAPAREASASQLDQRHVLGFDDWYDVATLVAGANEEVSCLLEAGVLPSDPAALDAFIWDSRVLGAPPEGIQRLVEQLKAIAQGDGGGARAARRVLDGIEAEGATDAVAAEQQPANAMDSALFEPRPVIGDRRARAAVDKGAVTPEPIARPERPAADGKRWKAEPKKPGGLLSRLFGGSKRGRD